MPPQKKMNRTGGGRQAKKEKGEESGDGTRDGSKLVYRPRLKGGRGYNATRWTHDPANSHVLRGRHGAGAGPLLLFTRNVPAPFLRIAGNSHGFKDQGGAAPVIYKDFALLLGLDRAPRYDPWQINCKSISATF